MTFDDIEKEIARLYQAKCAANPEMGGREAYLRVARERADLVQARERSLRSSDVVVTKISCSSETAGSLRRVIRSMAEERQEANPGLSYAGALKLVASENRTLWDKFVALSERL